MKNLPIDIETLHKLLSKYLDISIYLNAELISDLRLYSTPRIYTNLYIDYNEFAFVGSYNVIYKLSELEKRLKIAKKLSNFK